MRQYLKLDDDADLIAIAEPEHPDAPGCDSNDLRWANEVYTKGSLTGQYKNYRRGACGYLQDFENSCETEGLFSVSEIYYCTFQENLCSRLSIWAFIIPGVLMGAVGMFILSSTADDYLSPPIEFIVDFTNMS